MASANKTKQQQKKRAFVVLSSHSQELSELKPGEEDLFCDLFMRCGEGVNSQTKQNKQKKTVRQNIQRS